MPFLRSIASTREQAKQVVATTDNVVLKTNMAYQISAVMDHFYQMMFSLHGRRGR